MYDKVAFLKHFEKLGYPSIITLTEKLCRVYYTESRPETLRITVTQALNGKMKFPKRMADAIIELGNRDAELQKFLFPRTTKVVKRKLHHANETEGKLIADANRAEDPIHQAIDKSIELAFKQLILSAKKLSNKDYLTLADEISVLIKLILAKNASKS